MTPARAAVLAAARRIGNRAHRTPVLTSRAINALLEARLFFKCENLQRSGTFKIRGATNAVLSLPAGARAVATHSSGNHGAALALAAREAGLRAIVVLPTDTRVNKREAVERYGAEVVSCQPTPQARESTLREVVARTGATFVPPYDDDAVIAGAGTAALELLRDQPGLDQIWIPVGGGGLAAGTVLAVDGAAEVVLAEPALARDAKDSLQAGALRAAMPPTTVADGLRAPLGARNFNILRRAEPPVFLASEAAIEHWAELATAILKVVVEPSAAVTLAAMAENPGTARGQAGVVLTGGNV